MYAVVKIAGFQYLVKPGEEIIVPQLDGQPGTTVKFNDVLMVRTDDQAVVGTPKVANAFVEGNIIEHLRGKKVTTFKFIRRENYRRKKGHKQPLTRIQITRIGYGE
jgi:large subunit ribosomal protein L21|uniref:Large ribosomal subunit protein bL21 n=1 Tax=candidate division WOR-3 bacterium TaxID=2052148 RepID=A0A7V3PSY5_UNCW3